MDEIMVENEKEGNKVQTKEERLLEIEEVLKTLENGLAELYKSTNPAPAWKKFMLIRYVKTKKRIEFVQCTECKALLSFKQYSGTSHLNRHKCRIDENAIEVGPSYRTLSLDTTAQIQSSIIKNIMKYCADEFVTTEQVCDSSNFVEFAQSFVSLALKHGSVCLKDLFPNSKAVDREIVKFKDEKQQEIYLGFRQAINNECCSASMEIRSFTSSSTTEKPLLVMRLQYFENDFSALKNKVIFASPFNESNPDIFLVNLITRFKLFGGDQKDLQRMKIVTPNEKLFIKALEPPFSRANCIVNTILEIVNEAFEDCFADEITDFFSSCRNIVKHISESEKYNFELKFDNGSWKDKLFMMQSINEHYNDIAAISQNDIKFNFQFNKRRSEELTFFLEPFVEAIDDLSATSYTTANKVLLWWAVLSEHLQTSDDYSNVVKEIIKKAWRYFQSTFSVTMDDKINCFLDPRYKLLKMLPENERAEVMKAVTNLLKDVLVEGKEVPQAQASTSNGIPKAKRGRFSHFEAEKPSARAPSSSSKPKGKSRFSSCEACEGDMEENDELKIYMKLPILNSSHLNSEFDLIKNFWKSKRNTLPKLFMLATTRLHVPAYCGSVETCISLKGDLKDEFINELLLIKDNI